MITAIIISTIAGATIGYTIIEEAEQALKEREENETDD